MEKIIEQAKAGCEKIVAIFDEAIANIETAQEDEIKRAVDEIHAKYEERLTNYKTDRAHYVDVIREEVPDEVTADSETTEIPVSENTYCEGEIEDEQGDF